ncbi:CapA family protein [Nocardioides sp.]|uniref:CapA family protein n=1 Tax=Nocardioides sp. TaxID=35761 RepID=UPI002C204C63|nr:CapA family protein [Nocardioides sp.]HXH80666.1 CapA family protein [Nocardioides sp.]
MRIWLGAATSMLVILVGCTSGAKAEPTRSAALPHSTSRLSESPPTIPGSGEVTIAFAGDVHFERHLADLLEHPDDALQDIAGVLGAADVTMVNLETAITERGRPEPKEFQFRTGAGALDLLDAAGVDVVTVANNHGADYGPVGLRDTLAAKRASPIPIVGVGRNRRSAFQPFRTTVNGTRLAFLAADTFALQSHSSVWTAGKNSPGLAAARGRDATALRRAVERASARGETVIVYLHWGEELVACPTPRQVELSQLLAEAGADVVVGSHSHLLMGSGWLGDTYVNYGLGNFVWYHDASPETGVLRLTLRDGAVVSDQFRPARIPPGGVPRPVLGHAGADAEQAWRSLRGCTALSEHPPGQTPTQPPALAPYAVSIQRLGAARTARLSEASVAGCPVPVRELRSLRLSYLGFDGREHRGELIVHRRYARDVASVFKELYDARRPLHRMRPVEAYDGDNDRSLAANNTSGFNCRRVKGTDHWSDHAYGAAVDVNPVQNPYVFPDETRPPGGSGFAALDRSAGAVMPDGAIAEGDAVVKAFARIGWAWGGRFSDPDFQHFYAD